MISRSIELDLRANIGTKKDKEIACLIFRLIVIDSKESTISNTCYNKDCICEE